MFYGPRVSETYNSNRSVAVNFFFQNALLQIFLSHVTESGEWNTLMWWSMNSDLGLKQICIYTDEHSNWNKITNMAVVEYEKEIYFKKYICTCTFLSIITALFVLPWSRMRQYHWINFITWLLSIFLKTTKKIKKTKNIKNIVIHHENKLFIITKIFLKNVNATFIYFVIQEVAYLISLRLSLLL